MTFAGKGGMAFAGKGGMTFAGRGGCVRVRGDDISMDDSLQ